MRNSLFTSTALALALAISGTAFAAGEMKSNQSQSDQPESMERSGQSGATSGSGSTATTGDDAESYRSLNNTGNFSGPIAGGFTAEELIGTDVVGTNGETVGEVADVLIGPDGNANHVLVDVGGFLGIGAKQVALSLDELNMQDDQLATTMTEEELEAKPSYTAEGENWMREDSSSNR